MDIQITVTDKVKNTKIIVSVRPIAKTWQFDRMSVIMEKRELQTNKCLEVWHLHIEHKTGKILHRDKKYP